MKYFYFSIQHSEAVVQMCSVKKVFLEIAQNSQENTCTRVSFLIKLQAWGQSLFFNKVAGLRQNSPGGVLKIFANFTGKHLCWSLQACNVTKNRLLHKCFPVKFEKFWRTPILKNIWTTASVYWLLHHILIFTILYSTRFTFLQRTSSLLRN